MDNYLKKEILFDDCFIAQVLLDKSLKAQA